MKPNLIAAAEIDRLDTWAKYSAPMCVQPVAHQLQSLVGIAQRDPFAPNAGEHLRIVAHVEGNAIEQRCGFLPPTLRLQLANLAQVTLRLEIDGEFAQALRALAGRYLRTRQLSVPEQTYKQTTCVWP